MANFNDLPKPVREQIYRLHLIRDGPITAAEHRKIVKHGHKTGCHRFMPPLLELSKKIEREAARIYYGGNHFAFDSPVDAYLLCSNTWPRHLRLIRKVTLTWNDNARMATEAFDGFGRMKDLAELLIRVDEKRMLRTMLLRRKAHQSFGWEDPTPQQQRAVLKFPGMVGLLRLSGIPLVRFLPMKNHDGQDAGGPIPGGVLETHVAPRIMGKVSRHVTHQSDNGSFPFLSLSPELRNRIYDLLLCIPGRFQPSSKPSTSTAEKNKPLHSLLSILGVNKQVHDEAVGIFYHYNSFDFHYSLHLHGFLLSLGQQRQAFIRDINVHYADIKSGGMSLIEMTFGMLRRLTGLQRLEVVMHGELCNKIVRRYWAGGYSMSSANPALIPGMKALFELRGLKNISVRDATLEARMEGAKMDASYPVLAAGTVKACVVKLTQALEHFNSALRDAQDGRVNRELLEDNKWHIRYVFPTLKEADRGRSPEL
ncbi:hypothetical protein LTR85_009131 [Meristemomyces frigidus]|nr:hypothetical protein LTR85_009131 [Meristemomyces frigidus]